MKKQLMIVMVCAMSGMANYTAYAAQEEDFIDVSHKDAPIHEVELAERRGSFNFDKEYPWVYDWVSHATEEEPNWVTAHWGCNKYGEGSKHFRSGTPVGRVKAVFSVIFETPLSQINVIIKDPNRNYYRIIENDSRPLKTGEFVVVIAGKTGASCRLVGSLLRLVDSKFAKIKAEQEELEQEYRDEPEKLRLERRRQEYYN